MVIAVGGVLAFAAANLPPIQSLEIPKRPPSIEIVGLDGKPLANRGEMHGATVTIKNLPPYLPKAFIAIEDRRFYSHFGVDPIGLVRAVSANVLRRGVSQGKLYGSHRRATPKSESGPVSLRALSRTKDLRSQERS